MQTTLTVKDETTSPLDDDFVFTLDFPTERTSVRDLIRARVRHEVREYNTRMPEHFRGLVQPTAAEKTLNGFKLRKGKRIDADEQCEKAIEAFGRNGFILLVDDQQVDELNRVIEIQPDTTVTFLKLVPLVGG